MLSENLLVPGTLLLAASLQCICSMVSGLRKRRFQSDGWASTVAVQLRQFKIRSEGVDQSGCGWAPSHLTLSAVAVRATSISSAWSRLISRMGCCLKCKVKSHLRRLSQVLAPPCQFSANLCFAEESPSMDTTAQSLSISTAASQQGEQNGTEP